jgi:hypothetical protein
VSKLIKQKLKETYWKKLLKNGMISKLLAKKNWYFKTDLKDKFFLKKIIKKNEIY